MEKWEFGDVLDLINIYDDATAGQLDRSGRIVGQFFYILSTELLYLHAGVVQAESLELRYYTLTHSATTMVGKAQHRPQMSSR